MKKIVEYCSVIVKDDGNSPAYRTTFHGKNATDIDLAVNNLIDEGWQPIGSMTVTSHSIKSMNGDIGYNTVYTQAMVKYEKSMHQILSERIFSP